MKACSKEAVIQRVLVFIDKAVAQKSDLALYEVV